MKTPSVDLVQAARDEHRSLVRNLALAQKTLRTLARISPPVCADLARTALAEMKGKRR